jgi:hypothetical protein
MDWWEDMRQVEALAASRQVSDPEVTRLAREAASLERQRKQTMAFLWSMVILGPTAIWLVGWLASRV